MQNRVKKYFSFFLLVCCLSSLTSQIPGMPVIALKERKNVFGGIGPDRASSVAQTADGGLVMAGFTASSDGDVSGYHGGGDMWVVKLSATGAIQWQKTLGGTFYDQANSIVQTSDGGYIVAGYTGSTNSDASYDMWVVKLSGAGALQWQKTLGGTRKDMADSIVQTSDGGYIVAGSTESNDGDVSGYLGSFGDMWVVKLSATGAIQWQKTLGGTDSDGASSIIQTTDGGYAVAGGAKSNNGVVSGNHGNYDLWVVKLSATGAIQWQKVLGGTNPDWANSIIQTTDGGYAVAGYTESNDGDISGNHGGWDMWVIKLSTSGAVQWKKALGGSEQDMAYSIVQTADDGYAIGGFTRSNDGDVSGNHGDWDIWVIKLSTSGAVQWRKTIGGTGNDVALSITRTADDILLLAGWTVSTNGDIAGLLNGSSDFFIPRLDAAGNIISVYEDMP